MTKRPNYVFDDELYHWGIKGQRWGERRFQNEDGSWTPEGRERYGKGDGERVKIEKAKATYETQKYKANLKSKAQKEKDKRAAAEERNRIKEQAKTNKLIKKEQAKLDQQGAKKFGNTKNMSDEELATAVNRLKLQSEYNKQYYLAKHPDGALAKADRFFDGPTGQAVTKIAVATLPAVATAATNKILESSLKYSNKLDRDKAESEIEKNKALAENNRALARSNDATANSTKMKAENDRAESQAKIKKEAMESESKIKSEENERKLARSKQLLDDLDARESLKAKKKEQEWKEKEKFGWDYTENGVKRHRKGSAEIQSESNENKLIYDRKRLEREEALETALNKAKANKEGYEANKQRIIDENITELYKRGELSASKAVQMWGGNGYKTNIEFTKTSDDKVKIEKGNGIIQTVSEAEFNRILKTDPEISKNFFSIINGRK